MVWVGIIYGQFKKWHFIEGNLNEQRFRDKILRPIVAPLIHCHHLMCRHDYVRAHVTKICTQFLEAENVPVLPWPAYSPDMSPIERVWDGVFQFLSISSNFTQPLKRSGTTFHRPQSTA